MAETVTKSVECPKCGKPSATEILISANTTEDIEIRQSVFDESIFTWKCKECGYSSKYCHPLLYNDIEHRFMVYYIPQVERAKVVDNKLETEFSDLKGIRKRIVPDINAMKEKILIFERGYNDMAIELTKLAVSEVVSKETGHNVYSGYFTDMNVEQNSVSFQFFVGGDKRSYIQTTRLEIYKRSLDIVKKHFVVEDRQPGFLNIGREWAKTSLNSYKTARR